MMNFIRKHTKTIFLITITGFIAGTFVGFGSYFFGGKTAADAVIKINGKGIPYKTYRTLYNQALNTMHRSGEDVNEEKIEQVRVETVQQMIQEEIFWQQSKLYEITISETELAMDIQNTPSFQHDGKFSHQLYARILNEVLRMPPKDYEDSRKKQIAGFRLRNLLASGVRITEPELRMEYAREHNGDMSGYEENRDEFMQKLRHEKSLRTFNEWFKHLNQTVNVKVFLDEIEGRK